MTVLALVGAGVSWYVLSRPAPAETAAAYIEAWSSGDYAAMGEVATGGDVVAAHERIAAELSVETTTASVDTVSEDGDRATATFTVTHTLADAGEWGYAGELPLRLVDGAWRVEFSPRVIHPELSEGQTLTRVSERNERGHILAADGSRLDTEDAAGSVKILTGSVGTVTEEDLQQLGSAYQVGDPTGKGGLQQAYEQRLAGVPDTSIQVVSDGEADDATADEPTVVGTIEGADGEDVATSLAPAVQRAAAQAIVGQDKPAAFVAVRPSTGEILAAATIPGGYHRVLDGQYPPGSTFKIVSYSALLDNGLTMNDTMDCPKTADIGGWPFKNAHDAAYGEQTVTEAFATSCNTALVKEVTERLDSELLTAAAEQFGMNAGLDIGLSSTDPSFPPPENNTMLAAASIGQGKILTSPLQMATVAAAVADGSWRSPVLVTDPAVPDQPQPRPVDHAEALRSMMRAVVTDGTASEAGFTGEVYGKTGSAEFGTPQEGEELDTHAWFVGFQGGADLAFAVMVEGGGGGGSVAAPLAKSFLDAL
ncbi:hypothetical protein GCM10022402_07740 [Salinactinospora qingdaonensis]|uniref:NTF2-like N-terminal transpeptidase domain-containing protein n=1 Tax=Salinactinospora qingdaonensis TaxID=702744 RepID=A0ABP7F1P0_9ACTN